MTVWTGKEICLGAPLHKPDENALQKRNKVAGLPDQLSRRLTSNGTKSDGRFSPWICHETPMVRLSPCCYASFFSPHLVLSSLVVPRPSPLLRASDCQHRFGVFYSKPEYRTHSLGPVTRHCAVNRQVSAFSIGILASLVSLGLPPYTTSG
jgi:hypothetical protein